MKPGDAIPHFEVHTVDGRPFSYASAGAEFPPIEELLDWIDHVQSRCPECEGEAK